MDGAQFKENLLHGGRNNRLLDIWSAIHLVTGALMAWVMPPFIALLIMVLWEPLEVLVLSPLFAKFDIEFGYEGIRNIASDIIFDAAGVALGFWVLRSLWDAPFTWF